MRNPVNAENDPGNHNNEQQRLRENLVARQQQLRSQLNADPLRGSG